MRLVKRQTVCVFVRTLTFIWLAVVVAAAGSSGHRLLGVPGSMGAK